MLLRTNESLRVLLETIRTSHSRIRGRTLAGPMSQAIVIEICTQGLNLYVPSMITIKKGGNDNAQARVYVVGNAGANPDNVVAANITSTKDEDKSKGKRLEDVPVVREFPEVYPEDLSGILPTRQVEF
nr:putative reverse transcriptase domain-containing protein [Tanacetum cinerariifolium]